MQSHYKLFARSCLGTMALAIVAAPADAQSSRHARQSNSAASQAEEIRLLRAQVEALTARLDAQEAAQHATQAQAQAAQSQAATAATQAEAAQTQAAAATQAVPAQVKTALAEQPKPAPRWFDNTSVAGQVFFNASSIDRETNGANSGDNGTGFNIKRFYLTVEHRFDDTFSAEMTTDASNVVGSTSAYNFATGTTNLVGRGLFVKRAFLQAKLSPAFTVRLGSANMPWIPFLEGIYGYRHIENTLIDRTSFGSSADWGVHVLGDLADGLLSYQVSVVDGGGFRNVKVTKSVDVEGRVSAKYENFFAAVGGYTGKLANDVQSVDTFHTARRLDAAIGYKGKLFTVGGEYFWAKNYNNNGVNFITTDVSDKSSGYSAFASAQFTPKWSVFGRYDWVKPLDDRAPDLTDDYFNVGVQYSPVKIVDLALVYKRDRASDGIINTSNGPIGGSDRGTYDEVGLFGQFKF